MALEKVVMPMVGKILKVETEVGAEVKEGDVLLMFESMKLEMPLTAPLSGKVVEVSAEAGKVAEAGDVVASIEY